jgi:WD40 repeat protein/tRNA A-37 threonylcarbamoyl transferase component Bud32
MTPSDDLNPTVPRTPSPSPDDTRSQAPDDSAPDPRRTGDLAPPGATVPGGRTPPGAARMPTDAPPHAGEGVPGYALVRELGRGGMGVVYEARHLKLNRVVALKMMLAGGQVSRVEMLRFLAEAEAVAAVKHPNVVQVYDYGENDGRPFMALEFCPSGTLATLLPKKPEQATDPRGMAELLSEVARGVAAAHAAGIVHRDLKPGNVFLDADDTPKVADFGLAKRGAGADMTQTGVGMGTPAYMAPEQAKDAKFVGPQADVWALGVMLYEALTGTRPFVAKSVMELMIKIGVDEPPPPRAVVPAVPRDLELICLRCLMKGPHERYPTAKELADDLDRFARNEPISVRPVGRLERGYKWVKRKPVLAGLYVTAAAAVFLLAVGGVLAWAAAAARRNEAKAVEAKLDADAQRGIAEAAEGQAKKAFAGEAAARKEADAVAGRWLGEAARADEAAYRLRVATAGQVWRDNNVLRALRLLSDTKPEHRDFEWRYVAGLCDSSVRAIRPGGRLGAAAVSADGRFAYVGCAADNTVRGYDLSTGQEAVVYRGHAARPVAGVLLGDGKRAASAATDGTLDVWDTATGERVSRLAEPNPMPRFGYPFMASSPDGKRFALLHESAVTVWDAEALEKVRDIPFEREPARCVAFHPDGRLVVGTLGGQLRAWDLTTGRPGATARSPHGPVTAVAVAPDGATVWTGGEFGHLASWKGDTLAPVGSQVAHDSRIWQVTVGADGRRLLTGSLDQTAALWEVPPVGPEGVPAAARRERVFRGHIEDVMSVAFRSNGLQAVTVGDGTVRVWDTTRDAESRTLAWPPSPLVPAQVRPTPSGLAISPDGRHVAATTFQGVYVWEAASGLPVPGWPAAGAVSPAAVAFTPDGRSLAGAAQGRVWVRPLAGGESRWINAGIPFATKLAFDPTGGRLAVTGLGTCVLDVATGKPVWARKPVGVGANFGAGAVAFSPDGKLVAAAEATLISVYDAATGTPKHTIPAHTRPILALAFSPDGKRLASGSQDTTAAVWNVATGARELQLERTHDHFIYAVAFSPDGKRLVDASGDKTVRLYDARSGEEVLTLKGHAAEVQGAAFGPTGEYLATCARDGTVRLWDAPLGATAVVPKEADQAHAD